MPGQTKRKGEDKVGAGGNKSQNRDMKHMAVKQGEVGEREIRRRRGCSAL